MVTDAKENYFSTLGRKLSNPTIGLKTYWTTLNWIKKETTNITGKWNISNITNITGKWNISYQFSEES